MINVFRTYNPLNILWLIILLLVMRAGYLGHLPDTLPFTYVEPFALPLLPVTKGDTLLPVASMLIAGILILIQALLVNRLVNQYNLMGKPSFLPALMYVTLSSLFAPFVILSAPLICNFLVIWMLYKLFDLYKGDDAKSTAFDLGMIVAIGSMIYFPFIFMFLSIWLGLMIFRPFNWREWVTGILGYATVFFFLAVFYYMRDQLPVLYKIWLPLGAKFPQSISIDNYNYLKLIPVLAILILSVFQIRQVFYRSYVQIRKSFQLLFMVFLIGGLSFYVRSRFQLDHFLLCVIPLSALFAYYFLYAGARWFYEIIYAILVIAIIYLQFNTF